MSASRSTTAARAAEYVLRCRGCGASYEDDGYRLHCSADHEPALLVTEYAEQSFVPDPDVEGLFRYWPWLPAKAVTDGVAGPLVYRSEGLSGALGIRDLWISFSGFWPEAGAHVETGTFKEFEAWVVCSRLPDDHGDVLVVASAGSTAAAFARVCSLAAIPCVIVVPEPALAQLRFTEPLRDCVRFVALTDGADYQDAMQLADRVSQLDGFTAEGGARNVGRRDALAVPFLAAIEAIGRMPDFYFQAVGSGAGAIATHEVAGRLLTDGRFGGQRPRLMLSQNAPFCPIYRSWKAGGRELWTTDPDETKRSTQELIAPVLSHPRPPYAVRGGVFDALVASHGDVFTADNDEVMRAQQLFQETEGIDVHPAAGVATASLVNALREDRVDRDATIMLNVTGGGAGRLLATEEVTPAVAALEISAADLGQDDTLAKVAAC
jgi:cysteate synthase